MVMDEYIGRSGRDSTKLRRQRALRAKQFDLIRHKKIVETTGDDFRAVLGAGGVYANDTLRCLQNLALGLGWLPWALIPRKLWPQSETKPKRGTTWDEHQKIITTERNPERRRYYELLWETGAAQTDAANLTCDHIDHQKKILTYQRVLRKQKCETLISLGILRVCVWLG